MVFGKAYRSSPGVSIHQGTLHSFIGTDLGPALILFTVIAISIR